DLLDQRRVDSRCLASFPTRRSSDLLAAMGHTGEDTLQVSPPWQQDACGASLGDIYLVYGNDGHDVIADDNVEPTLNRILDEVERSEEHTSELQSRENLVCRLLLEKK